jgi:hypothetical protein
MDAINLLKEIANWTGWALIAWVLIGIIVWGRFLYEQRINLLKDEIENGKAYQYDVIYQRLTQRVKDLHQERDLLKSEADTKQDEISRINNDLEIAYSEIRELQKNIKQYDHQLDDLLYNEPDYCRVCTVDEEHIMMNTIYWIGKSDKLVGDVALVEEGVCSYCASVNLKCRVCGTIKGIDASATDVIECEGCCETLYTPLSFFGKNSDNKIKVSRLVSE